MALSWGIHLQPSWAKTLPSHPRGPGNAEAMTALPFGAQPLPSSALRWHSLFSRLYSLLTLCCLSLL